MDAYGFFVPGQRISARPGTKMIDVSANDNDFVIGLMGPKLTALSQLVQTMRSTVQTSTYLEKLGPFFVGRVVYQSGMES